MKSLRILFSICIFFLSSCAANYELINPPALKYLSGSTDKAVELNYKYNLLVKKYAKKETKFGLELVAVKVTNNSGKDLVFGKDVKLIYENGTEIALVEDQKIFDTLKQKAGLYLLYLLLTPTTLTTSSNNGQSSSVPIGYGVGPGLAGINLLIATSANAKFKDELLKYNINGTTIKNGATVYGLVGINSTAYESVKVKVE